MIEKTNMLIVLLNKAVEVLRFFVTGCAKTVDRTEKISKAIITVVRIAVLCFATCGIGFAVYKIIQAAKIRRSTKGSENTVNSNPVNRKPDYQFIVNNEESESVEE